MASAISLAALNLTTFLPGTLISWPLAGLHPVLAARSWTVKTPTPGRTMRATRCKPSRSVSANIVRKYSASFLVSASWEDVHLARQADASVVVEPCAWARADEMPVA